MEVKVDKDKCIGCGSCVALTDSKIFDFNEDGLAQEIIEKVDNEDIDMVKKAIDFCPTSAITSNE